MTEEEYTTPAADEINMLTALKKFKQFSGRSTRKEFWLFVLFTALVSIGLTLLNFLLMLVLFWCDPAMVDLFDFNNYFANLRSLPLLIPFALLTIVWRLGILCPAAAVAIRRMHDIGKSGIFALFLAPYAFLMLIYDLVPFSLNCSWIFWLLTIPIAIAAIVFLVLASQKSQPGKNQYDLPEEDEENEENEEDGEDDSEDGQEEDTES